jgi:hypothetical protein
MRRLKGSSGIIRSPDIWWIWPKRRTWQVTVLATKAGQTLAQKQFSVTAEGGM